MQQHTLELLIAEDDPDDRVLMQAAFKKAAGHANLSFVKDGIELIEYLSELTESKTGSRPLPDLILLDLNMPRMDGKQTLQELKTSDSILKRIPVVVMTTSDNAYDIVASYELGASSYIVKPRTFQDLKNVLNDISHYWLNVARTPVAWGGTG